MRKIYAKLIVISLALTLSVAVVVTSSYAWFVLSKNPAVSGIQVAISGGNTILIAADLTETVDGVTYHYPDRFEDRLNFGQHESYAYLQTLGGLTPVSTADGINWFLPEYYDASDEEVRSGTAISGELKDIADFTLEDTLEHVNQTGADDETIKDGSYYCLDFWVVAPGGDYTLRLSTGADSGGTFLVDLLQPESVSREESATGYVLAEPNNRAAAAARVGFLVNPDNVLDNSLMYYQASRNFDSRFNHLRGSYQEPNGAMVYSSGYRFTIYEPNADAHPTDPAAEGSYIPTWPVGLVADQAAPVSVMDRVTVQKQAGWTRMANAGSEDQQYAIEQIFQTAIFGKDLSGKSPEQIADDFYNGYLQGQLSAYVDRTEESGKFFKRTSDLAKYYGSVSREQLSGLATQGATDDVYLVNLQHNVPQRIRMFIWLEGQDVDCVNNVSASSFALSVELAGSNE